MPRRAQQVQAVPAFVLEEPSVSVPPPGEVQLAMREHNEREHQRGFDLQRDVDFIGNRRPDAVFSWEARGAARAARFWCAECPGRVFSAGEVAYGSRERNDYLRSFDPRVRALLAGAAPEHHDALIEAHDRRELGSAQGAAIAARHRPKVAKRRNPKVQRRREAFGEYFLRAYEQHGNITTAIESFIDLHKSDLDAYRQVLDTDRLYDFETLRQWMRETTTVEEREAAKERWHGANARERKERLAAHRAKPTR